MNVFEAVKEIPNGVYLTGFFSNYPTRQVMEDIFSFLTDHQLSPILGATYFFENIAQALSDMDHHKVNGKIVVRM